MVAPALIIMSTNKKTTNIKEQSSHFSNATLIINTSIQKNTQQSKPHGVSQWLYCAEWESHTSLWNSSSLLSVQLMDHRHGQCLPVGVLSRVCDSTSSKHDRGYDHFMQYDDAMSPHGVGGWLMQLLFLLPSALISSCPPARVLSCTWTGCGIWQLATHSHTIAFYIDIYSPANYSFSPWFLWTK